MIALFFHTNAQNAQNIVMLQSYELNLKELYFFIFVYFIKFNHKMEGGVNLDQLIKKDKEEAKAKKTHPISKNFPKNNSKLTHHHREGRKFPGKYNNRDTQYPNQRRPRIRRQFQQDSDYSSQHSIKQQNDNQKDRITQGNLEQNKIQRRFKKQENGPTQSKQFRGYALLVKGFVPDVSSEDILNLVKDRKIYSIKTQLKNKSEEHITKKDSQMEVIIGFLQKKQADSFIQEYSTKLLDGKHQLSFQYRHGL